VVWCPEAETEDELEQRAVRAVVYVIAGVVGLGSFLDARSNVIALSNREAWAFGLILTLGWVGGEVYVRLRRVPWRSHHGEVIRVTGLGWRPRLALIGALGMLAYSRTVPPPTPATPAAPTSTQANSPGTTSPRATLALLAADIERHLREFAFATGFQNRVRRDATIAETVEAISETWPLPQSFKHSAAEFSDLQGRITHGYNASDEEVLRGVESGKLILKTLEALPREKKVVAYTGVELFADPQGRRQLTGVWGLILENTSSDGKGTKSLQVFPTSRTDLRKGDEIAWEWGLLSGKALGRTWYRNPQTGKIEHAWEGSMEFVGRPLQDVNRAPR
jgi:hypothetical protein